MSRTIYRKVRIEGWIEDRNTHKMDLSEIAREMETGRGYCTTFDPEVAFATREEILADESIMEPIVEEFFGIVREEAG